MTLLQELRLIVLQERALHETPNVAFGLSWITMKVTDDWRWAWSFQDRRQYTSGSPKKLRGRVQHALTILAREGLIYTRRSPEAGVARWAHGETDKFFSIRISRNQALSQLSRTGRPYVSPRPLIQHSSAYFTESLLP